MPPAGPAGAVGRFAFARKMRREAPREGRAEEASAVCRRRSSLVLGEVWAAACSAYKQGCDP
jgi:hypothetical protein